MAILPIITVPDPRLRKISEPVERVDAEILTLLDDMLETMYAVSYTHLTLPTTSRV